MKGLLVFGFLWLLAWSGSAAALTSYTGETSLFQDTVWEGEVRVDGILTVAPGVTLEIRPGTRVLFTRFDSNGDGIGEHEIFVQGTFRALGTPRQPVVFTSAETDPSPGDWGAINLMASEEGNLLENCRVEYGYRGFHAHFASAALRDSLFIRNQRGAQFQESTVSVEGCRIVDNLNGIQFRNSEVSLSRSVIADNYWGLRCVYSTVEMSGCLVEGNLVNGANLRDSTVRILSSKISNNRRGLYLQRSTGEVRGNVLAGNSEHGILLEDSDCAVQHNRVSGNGRSGVKMIDAAGTFRFNDLAGNGLYALVNDGAGKGDATRNWWGTVGSDAVAALIRDGLERQGVGLVDAGAPLGAPPELPPLQLPSRLTAGGDLTQ